MRAAVGIAVLSIGTVAFGHAQERLRSSGTPLTGLMAGRVIDAISKQPVSGATVRLERGRKSGDWESNDDNDRANEITTGSSGEFRFVGLGPAEYSVSAWRDGYSEGGAAKTWARGTNAPISLAQNQSITNVEIRLWPNSELTGRVLDERGRPFAGVHVNVVEESFTEGIAQFSRHLAGAMTDERGEYRVSVQPPGRVIVCVDANYWNLAIPPLTPGRRAPDPASPIAEYSDAPSMLISSDGRYLTRFSVLPRVMTKTGESEAYVRTCAPAARSSDEATVVDLESGSMSVPDLIMRPEKSFRVSGRLYGPSGPLAG
jgi:hypothetical protein